MNASELARALKRLNISKNDLATITGVTPRQVNSWSRGVHAIPRSVAVVIGALDNEALSIDWLVDFVEKEIKREAE